MQKNKINFTKTALNDLPNAQPSKRDCYYDDKVNGLELRVTDSGNKSFSVYRWINGKSQRVVLGRYNPGAIQSDDFYKDPLSVLANNPGLSIEQARQLASAVLMQLSLGNNPLAKRRATASITLGELFKEYLHSYAIDHCKSWKVIEYCFHHYLNHWLNRPIDSIKRSDVQLLVNKIGRDHGQVTANRTFELLRAVINKGKQWSLVEGENPATGITKFKMKPRARFVYEAEFPKLIAAIEAEPDDDTRDYIMLSLHTGARKSNILSMRWENIDLNSGVWTIPDTKNGTAQTILLTKPELEILRRRFEKRREHKVDNGNAFRFVFPGTGASGHWADPKKDWLRILKRAEITDLHLHDLRRTLGSYMAMTGASLSVIGNALNHKDLSTTRKVYAHSAHEAELKAREVAHERMFAKKEKPPAQVVELNQQKTAVEF